ncbi:hypothetical protein JTE90_029203 [Oedothorax gibbosus]|uniref:Secreted protein n=1 Tax=Oedothorax gibbosus TaxID=931172 RepID=A0AAV6VF41_9ARAC|nr:hypothetical protein JTE90_029203 [Oedothorax gibbosus]
MTRSTALILRLISICLPCLKSAEIDEKETEDNPSGLNPVENDTEENNLFRNEYPDDLNPFASEESEKDENPNGKAVNEQP